MISFAEWDSWGSLIIEVLISLAIVIGLLLLVRRVNARAAAERQNSAHDVIPTQHVTPAAQPGSNGDPAPYEREAETAGSGSGPG